MTVTKPFFWKSILSGAAILVSPLWAHAQGIDIGKQIYETHCAVCHAVDGKGSGPFAGLITQRVPDLTILEKSNNGVFPFNRVYDVIDGREEVKLHGPRDMPIWGNYFNEQAPDMTGPEGTQADYTSFVRGRILALVGYVYTLQAK
ncbi:MAG: c-type cytochrome [Mesorhizobium sp.]|nr:MAG: c-type cytochrome [Mesorhizobium sp.]RWL81795.1 MAG: c-type cytochrome [Mesorhizobium sp.]RWL93674.1 MAG: c-type cytochrome [Mesorhizobium sp.]RWL99765.1 MAG: c-type cytochrome [Mesorhizobium sp.]TIP44778.1 MAG: cytochrome c [Mesorhizobium sp.]